MSIKIQAITLTGLIILLLSGGFFYHDLRQQDRLTQTLIAAEDRQLHAIMDNIEQHTFATYEPRLRNLLITTPEIVSAFARRDRGALYRHTKPIYISLVNENKYLYVMHFHLPDSTTLLRMHIPDFFGDDLKGVRPIVDRVHQEHTSQADFEMGRSGLYYRVVQPVFRQNNYIGAVELGIRVEEIIDAVQNSMDIPMFTYLEQKQWQKVNQVKDDSLVRRSEYVIKTEDPTLTDLFANDFFRGENYQLIEKEGRYYRAHNYPLFTTFQDESIGGLVLLQDITKMTLDQKNFLCRSVFFTILVCLTAFLVLSFYFNKILGSMLSEISSRKKAQKELDESSKKLLLLLNSTAEGIFGMDISGKCTFVNSSFLSILGYESEEIFIGNNIHEIIHFKQADGSVFPREDCPMCLAGKDGRHVEVDNEVLWRKDSSPVPVIYRAYPIYEDMELVGVVISFIDITERKKTEEEYKRLAVAVENTVDEIIITDLDGVIQYVNPAFTQVTGYSREEAIGSKPSILKSGKHDEAYYRKMWKTITRGDVWSERIFNKTKEGRVIEEEGTISPIKDEKGSTVGYVAVKRDMTEQNELENRLHQAHKMEAIGTLAGGIAHDFNNMLNGIMGFTAMSLRCLDDPGKVEVNLNRIQQASRRAANLVKNILAFSRQSEHARAHINLASVVQETVELLRGSLPATIEVRQEIGEQCRTVFADSGMIHQVIMNLCTNAYHAMQHDGGILTISLTPVELPKDNQLELPAGKYNLLSVSDTGHGISPEHLEKIFDPYFTTKKQGEGTGLGLATVHGIIRDHGGGITLQSIEEKGTTFFLYLPVSSELDSYKFDSFGGAEGHEESFSPVRLTEHILFVDDMEMNVLLGKEVLEEVGCRVKGMTDSVAAMELFADSPDEFDMVITDQTMPKLTGLEMAKKMVEIRPDLPIIVVTGYSDSATMEKLKISAITDLLAKPLAPDTLRAAVKKYLPGSSGQQHNLISKEQEKPVNTEEAVVNTLEPLRIEDVKQHMATTYKLPEDKIEFMLERAKKSLVQELDWSAEAAACSDLEQLSRSAHAIKGLLLNMGASVWADKAQYLEKTAFNSQEEEYGLLVDELKAGIAAMAE